MSEFEITPESLPPSWVVTNLGAVVGYGKTEKAEPSEIPCNAWVLELEDSRRDGSRIVARFTQFQARQRDNVIYHRCKSPACLPALAVT
jgi:hypothetical protein